MTRHRLKKRILRRRTRKPSKPPVIVQRCRNCRCTQDNCRGCIKRTGQPCYWVAEDLCSACTPAMLKRYPLHTSHQHA